jgi:hypothetical protein
MRRLLAGAAALACLMSSAAQAQSAAVEQLRAAMKSARWTGPMLASTAETLPHGHFYTEPYFYDAVVRGDHHPGSSGFYQYGLLDNLTVGFQPSFATATNSIGRGMAIGDFKLLSQLRLTHFTPDHQVPTIALVLNEVIPTGKDDRLGPSEEGHGSGAFATEVGINVQHWFLLKNGRLVRARINVLQRFYNRTSVEGRSVYDTDAAFRGPARPGARTTLIGAVEYSLTNEWVLALDVEADFSGHTNVVGQETGGGSPVRTRSPASRSIGFAPAVEYNWSSSSGALLGVWIIPKGRNAPPSVTPAIAISKFW